MTMLPDDAQPDELFELSAILDPFRGYDNQNFDDTPEGKKAQQAARDLLINTEAFQLPSFFTYTERGETYIINVSADDKTGEPVITLTDPNGHTSVHETLGEAYNSAPRTSVCEFTGDLDLVGAKTHSGMTYDNKNRMYITISHDDDVWLQKHGYLNWLFLCEEYLMNPNDFLTAWGFLTSHPAFWYRTQEDSDYWIEEYTGFWFCPTRNEKGEVVYMFETGAAVPPARTTHYHDLRLDVWADSYENGIIQLAALVQKFFHFNGTEREGVDYEPSELEEELTHRLSEIEQYKQEHPEEFDDDSQDTETDNDEENGS